MPRDQDKGQPRSPNHGIDVSRESIELPHKIPQPDQTRLQEQNKFIRKQNQILKKQLQNLSIRLDGQLQKRFQQRKRRAVSKSEDVSQMELQNAYKKCQIYRKQVNFYKKKLDSIGNQQKYDDYEHKIGEYMKEIAQLREQLKQMKKISKLQEKGLTELGAEGYLKITAENDKYKEENRRLKKQLDEYRRTMEVGRNHTASDFESQKSLKEITFSEKDSAKFEEKSKYRIKTQHGSSNKDQIVNGLQQKVEKDYQKIKSLVAQKNKLRDMLDNMKIQLTQKQKQNSALKEKIVNLRKNNQILKNISEVNRQESYEIEEIKSSKQRSVNNRSSPNRKQQRKSLQSERDRRSQSRQSKKQVREVREKGGKYPRLQECGEKHEDTVKWNHHQFSSKIKEIQVLAHESGYITDIHVRYQKGEPKKYEGRGKYSVFVCGEANQYIKYISGGFKGGYLQYLVVTTNTKRTSKFCRVELEKSRDCQKFAFEIQENQYPAALFGQNDVSGIRRLGCFIHRDSN